MTVETLHEFVLTCDAGITARLTDYGATLVGLETPDRHGHPGDIVLGFDTLEAYTGEHPYLGCTVGRVANRIGGAAFELHGKRYELAANAGDDQLHGGAVGFGRRVWDATEHQGDAGRAVTFTYRSPDCEEGYPGSVEASVTYTLTPTGDLHIDMSATTDAPTPVNLANHAYWNLSGKPGATIHDHVLTVYGDQWTPLSDTLIPTGAVEPVAGKAYDFRQPKPIGQDLGDGYDHNFVLNGEPGVLRSVAHVHHPDTGRTLELLTDQPAMQLYTSSYFDGSLRGKDGVIYPQFAALCLESQGFPDAVNQPTFPSVLLCPGETYRHRMTLRFGVESPL